MNWYLWQVSFVLCVKTMSSDSDTDTNLSFDRRNWDHSSECPDSSDGDNWFSENYHSVRHDYYEKFKANVHIGEWFFSRKTKMRLDRAMFVYHFFHEEEFSNDAQNRDQMQNILHSRKGVFLGSYGHFFESWEMLENVVKNAANVAREILLERRPSEEERLWLGMISVSDRVIAQMKTWANEEILKRMDDWMRDKDVMIFHEDGLYTWRCDMWAESRNNDTAMVFSFLSMTWFLKLVFDLLWYVKKEIVDAVDSSIAVMMGLSRRLGQNSRIALLPVELMQGMIVNLNPRGCNINLYNRAFRGASRQVRDFLRSIQDCDSSWYRAIVQIKTVHRILDGEDVRAEECLCLCEDILEDWRLMKYVCEHFATYGNYRGGIVGSCLSPLQYWTVFNAGRVQVPWAGDRVIGYKLQKAINGKKMTRVRRILLNYFQRNSVENKEEWLALSRYYVVFFSLLADFDTSSRDCDSDSSF